MTGKRWCFLCENPKGCQRSGWLWFHEECALRVLTNSGDLLWIMEEIKSGKFTSINDIKDYLKKAREFDETSQNRSRYFNALRKNGNKGNQPDI